MKKIDILNFITDFRKAPNDIKSHHQILQHLGPVHSEQINTLLHELQQARVIKETVLQGEKAYQVIAR